MNKRSSFYILIILGASLILVINSCSNPTKNPFGAENIYYPPIVVLKQGLVHKYHVHSTNRQSLKTTKIQYIQWKYAKDTLHETIYDAGMEPTYTRKILIGKGTSQLVEEKFHSKFHGISTAKITENSYLNWKDTRDSSTLIREYVFDETTSILNRYQTGLKDTMMEDKKAKILFFSGKSIHQTPSKNDTNIIESSFIYRENIGYFGNQYKSDNYSSTMELVEQIPLAEFELMRKKAPKRVAYIDTEKAKKLNPNFQLCTDNEYIYDYYNGDPDGHLVGRKGQKWKVVNQLLDENIIQGESGLLSIRFIINCEGEIDYFTSEQSDLDYQEYNFSTETVEHFMEITKAMKPWKPTIVREEKVNSYAYIIYKIRNGKVIDLLP